MSALKEALAKKQEIEGQIAKLLDEWTEETELGIDNLILRRVESADEETGEQIVSYKVNLNIHIA